MKYATVLAILATLATTQAAAIFNAGVLVEEPVQDTVDKRDPEARHRQPGVTFCGIIGASCNFKRNPEAEPSHVGFCGPIGSSCSFKTKREAKEAIDEATRRNASPEAKEAINEVAKRSASPKADPSHIIGFCGPVGSSCNFKTKREAEDAVDAYIKKSANAFDPAHAALIGDCGLPGGTCKF